MLVCPDISGLRMNRNALHVAMSVRPDLRLRIRLADKRVVRRHLPIVMKADDGAVMVAEILCGMRLQVAFRRHLTVAQREEQEPVLVERDLAAVMATPAGHRLEKLLDVGQPVVLEAATNQRRGGLLSAFERLR